MASTAEYAKKLNDLQGYKKKITAFKLVNDVPDYADPYDDISFLCAMTAEVWDNDKPFCVTNENIICGGTIYAALGTNKLSNEDFHLGMEVVIGKNKSYSSLEVMRKVNKQVPHYFKTFKYMLIGCVDKIEDPDMVMIISDANRIMKLCKAYTWKTGELVTGVGGTAWCSQSLPHVYRNKTMTFNMGDPPSRVLMNLEPDEVYCIIHSSLLPLIVENIENISDGSIM